MKKKYNVQGMTCSACEGHVLRSVDNLAGVNDVEVSLLTNSMVVDFDESKVSDDTIFKAVKDAGYLANNLDGVSSDNNELVIMKKKLIYCFIALGLLMYVSMSSMFDYPILSIVKSNAYLNISLQIIFLVPILIIKRNYFINGFKNLFHLDPTMDSLIALGAGASLLYSLYSLYLTIIGSIEVMHLVHNVYFESAGMIVTLISFGKYLEAKSKKKTTDAISKLLDLAPDSACLENGEIIKVVDLKVGDRILVKANESIPIDGKIVSGCSSVDESMITGESIPIEKTVDSLVIGGTNNLQGSFVCEVTKLANDTTLSKIIELVEEASSSKAPMTRTIDKVVRYFVPTVIMISIITLITWLVLGQSFNFAFSNAIAVLVISCPCALGLATPVAIMVSTGVGANNGILVKSAEVLENEDKLDVVVFDKTGTLTKGQVRIKDIYSHVYDNDKIIKIIASLEKGSSHILAEAFNIKAKEINLELEEVNDFKSLSGLGISGNIGGVNYSVGNLKMMKDQNIDLTIYQSVIDLYLSEGKTLVFLGQDSLLVGIVSVFDEIKDTSILAIRRLKKLNIETIMLTGDNKASANAINNKLKLDKVIAEVLPQDKENVIKDLQKQGKKVLMVGDGINDAPALSRSDVGVAIGKGNDIAIDAADVILMKDDLRDVVSSIELSKQTIKNIKENLFWAFIYNVIGIPVAAGLFYYSLNIRLDAMVGALCMSLSSLCVVSNALRLKRFKPYYLKENEKMNKVINIEGMMCQHCKKHVEDALNGLANTSANVELENNRAIVSTTLEDSILTSAVEKAGYKVLGIINE